jgi:hypothetical protein
MNNKTDPMGRAIAEYFKSRKAARLSFFVKQQIKASYDLVVSKLPKKYGIK